MGMKERVKMLCKERDMSLNKAEADCGFAKGYFSKLDKSAPSSANLQKIAEFFNVSIEYLIDGKDKTYSEEDALLDAHISYPRWESQKIYFRGNWPALESKQNWY